MRQTFTLQQSHLLRQKHQRVKDFRCKTCDTFFSKTGNLEWHLVTCSERMKHICPKNVYQLREILFDKLDAYKIPYNEEQKLFKNLVVFDFESICVKENSYKETETTNSVWKHVPISVSFSSILIQWPISFELPNPMISSSPFLPLRRITYPQQSSDEIEISWSWTATKKRLCKRQQQLNQGPNWAETVMIS